MAIPYSIEELLHHQIPISRGGSTIVEMRKRSVVVDKISRIRVGSRSDCHWETISGGMIEYWQYAAKMMHRRNEETKSTTKHTKKKIIKTERNEFPFPWIWRRNEEKFTEKNSEEE